MTRQQRRGPWTARRSADWYRRIRQRSRHLFDLVRPEAYYSRPISLRHPIVFYEGHLPAFSLNTLVKKGLGRPGVDDALERLFARGIDPEDEAAASRSQRAEWPTRDEVQRFADECDALILDALANAPLEQPGHPLLHEAQAVYAILEHEAMHQETMLYMWHQLPLRAQAGARRTLRADAAGATPAPARVGGPGRPRDARRTSGRDSLRLGQRVPGPRRRRARLRDRRAQRDQRAVPGVRRRRRLPAAGLVDAGRRSTGCGTRASTHPRFWARRDRIVEVARHVRRDRPAARMAGVRQPGRGGGVRPVERRRACRPKPSTTARPSATRPETSGSTRGARRVRTRRAGSSTSGPGIRSRSAGIRRARAPGACTT